MCTPEPDEGEKFGRRAAFWALTGLFLAGYGAGGLLVRLDQLHAERDALADIADVQGETLERLHAELVARG